MASIRDLEKSQVYSPRQKARISRKLSQRKADLQQTRIKLKPFAEVMRDAELQGKGFEFRAERGGQSVKGIGSYYKPAQGRTGKLPAEIEIHGIHDVKTHKKGAGYKAQHKKVKGKAMSRRFVRESARELAKRFPKAEILGGFRATGVREGQGQSFNLNKLKRISEKAGKLGRRTGKLGVIGTLMDFKGFQKSMRNAKKREKYLKKGLMPPGEI